MGEACSKCFHNLQGIEETAFKPGQPRIQKNTRNDGNVELISVRSSREEVVVAEHLGGWRENSINEEIAADCLEHKAIKIETESGSIDEGIAAGCRENKTTKVEKESDAEVEIRVEDINLDIETDKSGTIFVHSDARSDECIAGLYGLPDKSDGASLLTTEIKDTESKSIVNKIVVQSKAENTITISSSPSSVASQEQNNVLHANNTDNKVDSAELKTKIALYNYYSIAILKDALLTLKGNIYTERIAKDLKNRSEHIKNPRRVSMEHSATNESMVQKMEDFAAKVGNEILQKCIADSGKFAAFGQETQNRPKHETGSNTTQPKSLGYATVDAGVSEKCLHDRDMIKLVPSCKTVEGEFSASGDARVQMLPQRSFTDSQQRFSDEMENIAYLVVTSVIKDAMTKYLKTSNEIIKSSNDSCAQLTDSILLQKEGSTQEAEKSHAVTLGEGAADAGSAEPTDYEQPRHGGSSEAKNPLQCGNNPFAVEHTKTSRVEVSGDSGLNHAMPGNNDSVPQNDRVMSQNEGMMSRNEATLLGNNKQTVIDKTSDQKNTMLTQESQFSSFLDRVANDVISQGVTIAVVQTQKSNSCQQQKFDMKANKEGIATEEKVLKEGQSNSFEVCVIKQTENIDVLGWFAERLISQLLEQ
eukprot:Seg1719.4 transcript_id=Seg1719.4/GoldUCD/mRNA.D3Y31 product="hypothetical protein" protein_id=Seg1719.4/GoldUCD/D3Y31